jgi:hypothetical protein
MELPVSVFADTGLVQRLKGAPPGSTSAPPPVRVWLAQVRPSRPGPIEAPLPGLDSTLSDEGWPSPPGLEVDPGLKPPLLRARGTLRVRRSLAPGWVELDVRVAEDGSVSDAMWAGGSDDSALVAAAVSCALEMRFYPALMAGQPVAVWCRQRFDIGGRSGLPPAR